MAEVLKVTQFCFVLIDSIGQTQPHPHPFAPILRYRFRSKAFLKLQRDMGMEHLDSL